MKNYAVNLASKRHRLLKEGEQPAPNETVVTADADGWIEWNGGECPLPYDQPLEYKMRGREGVHQAWPSLCYWSNCGLKNDIIAYRPIIDQPASEEVKEWDGVGLPPVSEKVEIFTQRREWEKGIVIMHHDNRALVYLDSAANWRYESGTPAKIRPLPSPRDQWVEQALGLVTPIPGPQILAQAIYDAMIDGTLPTPGSEQ